MKLLKTIISVIALCFIVLISSGCTTGQQNSLQKSNSPTFHGYTCTDDCSGHEAGYNWAQEKGITDPDDCRGKSISFIEGCKAYAEDY